MPSQRMWCLVSMLLMVVWMAPFAPANAQPSDGEPLSLDSWADASLEAMLADCAEDGDLGRLTGRARVVMDTLIAWHPEPGSSDAFARAFVIEQHAEGLTRLGARAKAEDYRQLAAWLFDYEGDPGGLSGLPPRRGQESGWQVAQAISALRIPEADADAGVYRVLTELHEARSEDLGEFAELVAALAVVFDAGNPENPVEQEIENPAGALDVFTHYADHAKALQMDPRRMPGPLLVHAVDAAVSAKDLEWALLRASGNAQVGALFHEIAYDSNALRRGNDALRLNEGGGFGLPVILERGGVCRHQAFFASSVGKSIGVPTVYMRASGIEIGHAWVGYLRKSSRRATWDMSEGRYDDYQKLRGEIVCPQTRAQVSDQEVAMTGELLGVPLSDRLASAALATAASRFANWEKRAMGYPPVLPEGVGAQTEDAGDGDRNTRRPRRSVRRDTPVRAEPRPATTEMRFDMLRQSAEKVPWDRHSWSLLLSWADDLSTADRQAWLDAVHTLVGRKYPDVLVSLVSPLIAAIDDPAARDAAWAWLADRVRRTPQLSLEVAVRRADGMVDMGQSDEALAAYSDAARRFAREGPFVMRALEGAQRLLNQAPDKTAAMNYQLDLYGDVFRMVPKPVSVVAPEYLRGSTYVQVGSEYASLLRRVGRDQEARQIRRALR